MVDNIANYLNDVKSITFENIQIFVIFCDNYKYAQKIQSTVSTDIASTINTDYDDIYYLIPHEKLGDKIIDKCLSHGWNYDKNQQATKYTITTTNPESSNAIYTQLIQSGFYATMLSNNLQIVVTCLQNSEKNDQIISLQDKILNLEKSKTQTFDDYFDKVIFYGKVKTTEYRNIKRLECPDLQFVEQHKDSIINEILYRYFNKRVRNYLIQKTFPKKFDANKLDKKTINNINILRDFLYDVAEKYLNIQIENGKPKPFVMFNYLKTNNAYRNIDKTLQLAKAWHKEKRKQIEQIKKIKKQSESGAYKVMDFDNGYYMVILYSPNALPFEGQHMHHCISSNTYYTESIKHGYEAHYSLRDKNGEPHLTIEVTNGEVTQCQGRPHTAPSPILREMVRAFMAKNNLTIPDVNGWNKHIAYIKQDGIIYDIFNLPHNFVVKGMLNLCGMGLDKLPDMSTITVEGSFTCATNNLSDLTGAPRVVTGECQFGNNPLISLRGLPHIIGNKIYLARTQLTTKSFVPMHILDKLDSITGINEDIRTAWYKQIQQRKMGLQNITTSLLAKTKN